MDHLACSAAAAHTAATNAALTRAASVAASRLQLANNLGHAAGSDARGQAALLHALGLAKEEADTGLPWAKLEEGAGAPGSTIVSAHESARLAPLQFAQACWVPITGTRNPHLPAATLKLLDSTGRVWPGGEASLARCAASLRAASASLLSHSRSSAAGQLAAARLWTAARRAHM